MKLRFLPVILLELVLAAVSMLVVNVLINAGFDALPASLLAWMRAQTGFLGGVLAFVLQIGAYAMYLAAWVVLRTAVYSLIRQGKTEPPAAVPPPGGPVPQPDPTQICPAFVISKRKRTIPQKKNRPPEVLYYAIFGLNRYQHLEFPVPQELYISLSAGDRGTLSYREDKKKRTFLWFRREGEEIGS